MSDRPGCLSGLLKLFLLNKLFDWLQDTFGFGQGGVCGCGCGMVMMVIFLIFACSIITGTNWLELGF
jgi:hypothetical protein